MVPVGRAFTAKSLPMKILNWNTPGKSIYFVETFFGLSFCVAGNSVLSGCVWMTILLLVASLSHDEWICVSILFFRSAGTLSMANAGPNTSKYSTSKACLTCHVVVLSWLLQKGAQFHFCLDICPLGWRRIPILFVYCRYAMVRTRRPKNNFRIGCCAVNDRECSPLQSFVANFQWKSSVCSIICFE